MKKKSSSKKVINSSESDKHLCINPNNGKSEPSFDSNTLASHQCREIVKLVVLVAGEGDRGGMSGDRMEEKLDF